MRRLTLLIAATVLLLLPACGDSQPTPSGSKAPSIAGGKVDELFSQAMSNLSKAQHIHETFVQVDNSGTKNGTIDVTQDSARIQLQEGPSNALIVVSGGKVYYSTNNGASFQTLSGTQADSLQAVIPGTASVCAQRQHGNLTLGETATVDGLKVVAIKDDGNGPGASVTTLWVTDNSTPQVVRVVVTGEPRFGGNTACGPTSDDTSGLQSIQTDYDFTTPVPQITSPPEQLGTAAPGA